MDDDERRYGDSDTRADAFEERLRRRSSGCLCGNPDWPGQCPGAANCPVHGEDMIEEDEDE